jgi:hypothetical protein
LALNAPVSKRSGRWKSILTAGKFWRSIFPLKALGNAVVPQIPELIARRLLEVLA